MCKHRNPKVPALRPAPLTFEEELEDMIDAEQEARQTAILKAHLGIIRAPTIGKD